MAGPQLLLPDARNRSATAVDGKADMRDENIFSSIIVGHGGAGQQKLFTVPQGQAIPRLVGANIAPTAAHQLTHSELTTNLSKAGEAGSALGDFAVRSIGINFETAYSTATTGLLNTYGFGQQETNEMLAKCFFQFKIAGKKQIEGALFMFPAVGGAFGSVSTTGNAQTVSQLTNGWPGAPRRLKLPILVARTDTIEGILGVASSSSLVFSVTTGVGQCGLVWAVLGSTVKGDVR